jgi:hypothetical protein
MTSRREGGSRVHRCIVVAELSLRVIMIASFLRGSPEVLLARGVKVAVLVTLLERIEVGLVHLRGLTARLTQFLHVFLLPF